MSQIRDQEPMDTIKRLQGDVDGILKMYDLAEQVYPYTNIQGDRSDNENTQRRQASSSYIESPDNFVTQPSFMPFIFVYMMSRPGSNHALDFRTIFARPARALGWLMLGTSIMGIYKVQFLSQKARNNREQINVNLRVSQNEQTHAILKTMNFHLNTRQMGVWDQHS